MPMNKLKNIIVALIIPIIGFYLFRFRLHPVIVLFAVFSAYYWYFVKRKKKNQKEKIEDAKFKDLK